MRKLWILLKNSSHFREGLAPPLLNLPALRLTQAHAGGVTLYSVVPPV
jgi:hypothetical protein